MARHTSYKPEYCQMLIEHRRQGLSYESFAAVIGCCRRTLYEWEKQHEGFLHAKRQAKEVNLLTMEKLGVSLLSGKMKGNPAVWIFMMKNFHGWGDDTNGEDDPIDGINFIDPTEKQSEES